MLDEISMDLEVPFFWDIARDWDFECMIPKDLWSKNERFLKVNIVVESCWYELFIW